MDSDDSALREVVEVDGHIIDSPILAKVLDMIVNSGGAYRMLDVDTGHTNADPSRARFEVRASDPVALMALLDDLQAFGVNRVDSEDAATAVTDLLFAGNGFATHDLEANVFGTSLGTLIVIVIPGGHGASTTPTTTPEGSSGRM